MRRTILIVALLAGLLVPASAQAATQTASRGGVVATITYHGRYPLIKGLRIKITVGGKLGYEQAVDIKNCTPYCAPADLRGGSVKILDLEGDGRLEVVLEATSAGAHCCFYDQVYTPGAGGGYSVTTRDFANSGAALRDLSHDRRTEFVTADNAFAYEFADYAESGMPIEILRFTGGGDVAGRFVDVTRHYPALIRRDARQWWKAYEYDRYSGRRGLIAAWAADEYNLGRRAAANRTLSREVRAHHISAHFAKRLRAFLKRQGYAR